MIPDLLVYAAMLANLRGKDLAGSYHDRLIDVAERNGTGADTALRALSIVEFQ